MFMQNKIAFDKFIIFITQIIEMYVRWVWIRFPIRQRDVQWRPGSGANRPQITKAYNVFGNYLYYSCHCYHLLGVDVLKCNTRCTLIWCITGR